MKKRIGGGRRRLTVPPCTLAAAAFFLAVTPTAGRAQEPAHTDSLRLEVARLRARLDSLMRVVERLEAAQKAMPTPADTAPADPLAALRAAAAAAAGATPDTTATAAAPVPAATPSAAGPSSLSALNPEVTVTGDFLAVVDADDPDADNFVAREFELSLQSNLDPYSRAKVFIARHTPGGEIVPFETGAEEEPEIEVEEGYVEWLNLPYGIGLTLGRFRQKFGQLNRWHSHALPGQQLPLPYLAFFGEEGLAQTGASIHWLAPVYGFGTYEVWLELARSGNEMLFGESRDLSVLGHLNAFYDLGRATYFELGVSGMTGPSAVGAGFDRTRLAGVDFALDWRPPQQGRYRGATLRGGAVLGRVARPLEPEPESAFGAFAIGEYKLNRRWTLGARYEYTEDPLAPDRHAWLTAPTLTWWQSEFVRIRAEFDYLRRPEGILRQFVIQTTVAMGPHKHETY
ncbi:MAG TPA: hypothetical protein VF188_03410 [Longimicrobiales bacterium]